jgi:uncharacterized YceG family protein
VTPPQQGGRTAEEREAARREREARRAERDGRPPPEEPTRSQGAPFDADSMPSRPRRRKPSADGVGDGKPARKPRAPKAEADAAAAASQARPRRKKSPDAPAKRPATEAPAPVPPAEAAREAPADPPPVPPAEPAPQTVAAEAQATAPQPATPAGGARTESRPIEAPPYPPPRREPEDWLAEAQRLTQPQAAPPGEQRRHGRARIGLGFGIFAIAVIAVLLFAAWFANSLFQPFKGEGKGDGDQIRVVVPRGASVGQIGDLLKEKGVVSSSFFFQTRARLDGRTGNLKPGSYRLRHDMSFAAALDALEKGTPPSIVVVTIPEGRSRTEVASLVKGKLDGSYLKATRHSKALDPREYGAKGAKDLEGFLFPATYELKRGKPMSLLVSQQLSAFRQKFDSVDMRYARKKNLTPYDVLIIASLIEREAQLPKERPVIASVIYNRLHEGMPLGIDASVRYITHNWSRPLRESELANPSPYNTRIHDGLPPGPIGSPGLASIEAAAHPAKTGYLFYVVKPGGNGAHAFSKTDAEFQRDVDRYNAEREKRGGKSPANP